jgi:hypothetical protein
VARRLPWSRNIDELGTRAFRLVAIAYVGFGLLDCVTTGIALTRGGHEGNRVAAALYEQYGLFSLFAFKAVIVAVILGGLVILPRRAAVWLATAFTVAVAFAVVGNLRVLPHLG